MSKIAALLNRKPAATIKLPDNPDNTPIDVDEELFSTIGAELGSNNELLRNLLLNANAKIGDWSMQGKGMTATLVYPIPAAPGEGELSADELASVAGAGNCCCCSGLCTCTGAASFETWY